MIPIHGNLLGFGMFIMGGVIAGVGGLLLKLPDAVVMFMVGVALIAMDGVVRWRARSQAGWLMQRHLGGYLFITPVWIVGIVVCVANVVNAISHQASGG